MPTFETLFPILMIPKKKGISYKNIEELPSEFSMGTGFFVSNDGVFMSVGHNFKDKNEDFYAVLVSKEGEKELRQITDYQTDYIDQPIFNENTNKGRDLAIGKIVCSKNEICSFFTLNFESQKPTNVFINGYLRNKEIEYVPYDNDDPIKYKPLHTFMIQNHYFYNYQIPINLVKNYEYIDEVDHNCVRIKDSDWFANDPEDILKGMSGAPILNADNQVLGIYFRGNDKVSFFIPTKNRYFEWLYHRYLNCLTVEPLKDFRKSLLAGKEYPVLFHKDKHFPQGEECVKGEDGKLITLLCFKHKIHYK
jgi:SpoIVB peptidase S55